MPKARINIVPKKSARTPSKSFHESPLLIVVTGTPGTGKTVLARKLSLFLHATYVDLNKMAKKEGLSVGFDAKRGAHIIDEYLLYKRLKGLFLPEKTYILDSHLSHHFPSSKVSVCIVVRCPLPALKTRLKDRGYPVRKIEENLAAEAFEVCLTEAREAGHRVIIVDAQKPFTKASLRAIAKAMAAPASTP